MAPSQYGTVVPKLTREIATLEQPKVSRRLKIPLRFFSLMSDENKTLDQDLDKSNLELPPTNLGELFTGLHVIRTATENNVGKGSWSSASGINSRPQNENKLFTLDCFKLSAMIDQFIASWNNNVDANAFSLFNLRRVHKLADVSFTSDGNRTFIILSCTGNWPDEWFEDANRGDVKQFFETNAIGPGKFLHNYLNEMFTVAMQYLPSLQKQYKWKRMNDSNKATVFSIISSLLRASLDPTAPAFERFLTTYRTIQPRALTSADVDFAEDMRTLFKYFDDDARRVATAAIGEKVNDDVEVAKRIVESLGGNPQSQAVIIKKSELEKVYDKSSTSTIQNLVERFAKELYARYKEYGSDFRQIPGYAQVNIQDLGTVVGAEDTLFYILRESTDWLQEKVNRDFPSYGDVLKTLFEGTAPILPHLPWRHFARTVFPKESGLSFSVKPDAGDAENLEVEVTRPHNFRSFQYTDHGEYVTLLDGEKSIYGRYKGDGTREGTQAAKDFRFDARMTTTRRYGPKTFTLHFTNNVNGDNTFISTKLSTTLPNTPPDETFETLALGDTMNNLELECKLHIAVIYRKAAYEGFVKKIEAFVHLDGSPPESGIAVTFDPKDTTEQTVNTMVPDGKQYRLSARYVTSDKKLPFQTTATKGATTAAAVVTPPATTRPEIARVEQTADQHVNQADAAQTNVAAAETDMATINAEISDKKARIEQLQQANDLMIKEPTNHYSDDINQPLKVAIKAEINNNNQKINQLIADIKSDEVQLEAVSRFHGTHVIERESSLQQATQKRTQGVLEEIREAVQQTDPTTVADFYKIMQRRSYNLPLNKSDPAAQQFLALSPADQTFAISHRDKLRVFMEKQAIDRDQAVSGEEFVTLLQNVMASHMPKAVKQAESSFRAPSRSLLRAKTKGIGRPFMKKNASKLRLRLA